MATELNNATQEYEWNKTFPGLLQDWSASDQEAKLLAHEIMLIQRKQLAQSIRQFIVKDMQSDIAHKDLALKVWIPNLILETWFYWVQWSHEREAN